MLRTLGAAAAFAVSISLAAPAAANIRPASAHLHPTAAKAVLKPSTTLAGTGAKVTFAATLTGVAAARRPVQLQVRKGTAWVKVSSVTWSGKGKPSLTHTPTAAGTYSYRAFIPAFKKLPAVTGAPVSLKVQATKASATVLAPTSTTWDVPEPFSVTIKATPTASLKAARTAVVQVHRGSAWVDVASTVLNGSGVVKYTPTHSGRIEARVMLKAAPGLAAVTTPSVIVNVSAAPTAPVAVKSVKVGPETLGVVLSNQAQRNVDTLTSVPAEFGSIRLWDSGTSWRNIETSPGYYDWKRLDKLVLMAEANHQSILYTFGSTPQFYATKTDAAGEMYGKGSAYPPTSLKQSYTSLPNSSNAYANFVYAVANRYQGRIDSYQAGNEINLVNFWQGSASDAAEMTKITNDVVKRVNTATSTHAITVSSSLATRKVKYFFTFAVSYFAGLSARNWPVDVYAAHFYPLYASNPVDCAKLMGMFQRLLREANAPAKDIWNTEVNYRTNPKDEPILPTLSDSEVRAFVAQTYIRGLSAGVTRTYWYGWMPSGIGADIGITMYSSTEAYSTITKMQGWLSAASSMAGCTTSAGGLTSCKLTMADRSTRFLTWSEAGTALPLSILGTVKSVQTLSGSIGIAAADTKVGTEPALVELAG